MDKKNKNKISSQCTQILTLISLFIPIVDLFVAIYIVFNHRQLNKFLVFIAYLIITMYIAISWALIADIAILNRK